MLRVALIGCGLIAESHARAYDGLADRARITVFCDTVLERADALAASVPGSRATDSFESVLADPEVDAVEILTPHHLHLPQVVAALEAGKHVHCQKPLGRTLEECRAMADAAQQTGKALFYGEMAQTSPAARAMAKEVLEGRIGTLVAVHGVYAHWQSGEYLGTAWRYDPAVAGGGALLDGGIHCLNVVLNIGGAVETVGCRTHRFREELGGEDTASLSLQFSGGAVGTFLSTHASRRWPPGPTVTAFGTEGLLALDGLAGAVRWWRPGGDPEVLVPATPWPEVFREMAKGFLDAVDGLPSISTAETAMRDLAVVLAAYRSAESGTFEPL